MQLDNFLLGSCHVFDTKKFLYGSANSTLKFLKQYTFPPRDGKIPITFFSQEWKKLNSFSSKGENILLS